MRLQLVVAVAAGLPLLLGAAGPAPLNGRWINEDQRAVVEFTPCGNKMCGHIQRFLIAEPAGGARDTKNPEKAKRSRRLLGATVFWDMTADGAGWKGQGYVPEGGRTYRAHLTVHGNRMDVKGCVAVFCKTVQWTRTK